MSAPAATIPLSTLDDDAWDDLLSYIEEKRVIPIVGPELLRVESESGPRLLYDWLATRLAAKLSVDVSLLPQPYTLNDVVCWFLAARGRREEAYVRLRTILKDAAFEPPAALRRLAAIDDFNLFVTTTFDPLLEAALNMERFDGAQSTEVLSYAPNRVTDLPAERDRLTRPVVYHLFGKVSASPTYVISDEDLLEFICALQSEHLAPEKLFHELEHSHLLFIGSNFSNWLARLFLRMAKRQRLSDPRDVGEILADNHSSEDERLVSFFQSSRQIRLSSDGSTSALASSAPPATKRTIAAATSSVTSLPPGRITASMGALRAGQLNTANYGDMQLGEMRLSEAVKEYRASDEYGTQFARLDPANFLTWNNLAENQIQLGQALANSGHPRAGLDPMRQGLASYGRADQTNFYIIIDTLAFGESLSTLEADLGDSAGADATLAVLGALRAPAARAGGIAPAIADCGIALARARVLLIGGDPVAAEAAARPFTSRGIFGARDNEVRQFSDYCEHKLFAALGTAEYETGRAAAALLDGLPAEMRSLRSVILWRKRIREAGAGKG